MADTEAFNKGIVLASAFLLVPYSSVLCISSFLKISSSKELHERDTKMEAKIRAVNP